MNLVSQISIHGFRSIKDLGPLELRPINVLIGPNGSGKSNLISFFHLLNFMASESLQGFVAKRGFGDSFLHFGSKTSPMISGEIVFRVDRGINQYDFTLAHAAGDTLIFTREKIAFRSTDRSGPFEFELEPGGKESALFATASLEDSVGKAVTARFILGQLGRKRVYHFHDTGLDSALRKAARLEDNIYLRADGGNLPAFLVGTRERNPENYRRIILQLRRLIPGFHDFVLEPEGRHILLRWTNSDTGYTFGPHQFSDGSLRLIALLTLLLQSPEALPDMIIIDEPELGLHPCAETILAGLIRSVSAHCQILVATQSASFVDCFDPEDVIVCEMKDGASEFSRPSSAVLAAWLEDYSLGDIWRKNVVGGQP